MMQAALLDVNVLLPALLPQHPAHATATAWLGRQPAGSLRYALPVQLGVLRLLSQALVMGAGVLSPEVALKTWAALVEALQMQEIGAPQPAHGEHLLRFVTGRTPTPQLWTDAWLAALAHVHGCAMVTFDQGFRSFPGLAVTLLQP